MNAPLKRDPAYAYGKLTMAIDMLAVGAGDIRERLHEAFTDFHAIAAEDFPETLRDDYNWIVIHLTRFGPRLGPKEQVWSAAVANTMNRIKRQTGVKIAKRLVKLREDLADHLRRRDAS